MTSRGRRRRDMVEGAGKFVPRRLLEYLASSNNQLKKTSSGGSAHVASDDDDVALRDAESSARPKTTTATTTCCLAWTRSGESVFVSYIHPTTTIRALS